MAKHHVRPDVSVPPETHIGDTADRGDAQSASALAIPICRRRALLMIGGSVAAAAALPMALAGCSTGPAPTAWVATEVTTADLEVDQPVEVPFAGTTASGADLVGSAWLVAQAGGSVVAFDPRCTHQACAYTWAGSADRFECACHEAGFAVDGNVLYGPPPRPLARFETRTVGDTIELAVPENFSTPIPGD